MLLFVTVCFPEGVASPLVVGTLTDVENWLVGPTTFGVRPVKKVPLSARTVLMPASIPDVSVVMSARVAVTGSFGKLAVGLFGLLPSEKVALTSIVTDGCCCGVGSVGNNGDL